MSKCRELLFLGQNVFKGLPNLKTMLGGEMTTLEYNNFCSRYLECTLIAKSSLNPHCSYPERNPLLSRVS